MEPGVRARWSGSISTQADTDCCCCRNAIDAATDLFGSVITRYAILPSPMTRATEIRILCSLPRWCKSHFGLSLWLLQTALAPVIHTHLVQPIRCFFLPSVASTSAIPLTFRRQRYSTQDRCGCRIQPIDESSLCKVNCARDISSAQYRPLSTPRSAVARCSFPLPATPHPP